MKGGSDILFQVLVSPLVCEKIDFHKEKDGVSFAFGECNIYQQIMPKLSRFPNLLLHPVSSFD